MYPVTPLQPNLRPIPLELVLYAPDNRHVARLGAAVTGHGRIRWVDSREVGARQLLDGLAGPELVLLDYCGGNAGYSSELARQLRGLNAAVQLVGIGNPNQDQASNVLAAVRAGVRDIIEIDAGNEQVLEVLDRVASAPPPQAAAPAAAAAPKATGRLAVLLGVRPGLGTSTLAAHLGVLLAGSGTAAPREPGALPSWLLLLDLGQPAADTLLYLGMEASYSYDEALRNVERIDRTFAASAFAHHASGLAVLGNGAGTLLKTHEPGALIERLRAVYPLVLCDAGGLPVQLVPDALLRAAGEIWLVADQAIGSLVSLNQTLQDLEQRGLRDERVKLVVNRFDPNGGLSDSQIAQRFKLPLLATVPDRARVLRANAGLGRLLTEAAPRDPYLGALTPLLNVLDRRRQAAVPAEAARSPLSRLANLLGK